MKFFNKYKGLLLILLGAICFAGCSKDDSSVAYGSSYVYMPEAIVQSGGTSNTYTVPTASSGVDSSTYNFIYDSTNNKIKVILGVYRSGLEGLSSFSVTVSASTDTITKMITAGKISNGVAMSSSIYSLPSNVTVPSGSRSVSFYLSLNLDSLKNYTGKNLALAVSISNPTKYTLDTTLATTIVVVNVNNLLSLVD